MCGGMRGYMNYAYWLTTIPGIGNLRILRLLAMAGCAREVYGLSKKQLEKTHLFRPEEVECILASKNGDHEREYHKLIESGMYVCSMEEEAYPQRLRDIANPPFVLFGRGKPFSAAKKTVAIVGARQCSEYGYAVAKEIGGALSACGAVVISGMARGIDAGGQWGALKAGGTTYAVLGCGADVCYPSTSRNLYQAILEKNGGILSEYPPGTKPRAGQFPQRNRIIAGLSDVVIVVEARKKSGSLITVDLALEQGKDIYAVPGRIHDALGEGCNYLISQGAGIIFDVELLAKDLNLSPVSDAHTQNLNNFSLEKEERLVYSCLDLQPKSLEELLEKTQYSMQQLAVLLDGLIQKELIAENFKNYYVKRL